MREVRCLVSDVLGTVAVCSGGRGALPRRTERSHDGGRGEGSSELCELKARGSHARLDEMKEDPAHLLGIGDDGEDPHLGATAGTTQGIDLIDFCEQARPCSTGFLGGHGLIWAVLMRLSEAEGGLLLMLLPPPLGSEAHEVGLARPGTRGSRGIQSVSAIRRALWIFLPVAAW